MTVFEMVERAGLEVKAAVDHLDTEVTGGYSGDLLSAVMANAEQGNVWVTWHVHPNIVAVAVVIKLAAIVLASGRQPEEETLKKAQQEGIPILISELPAFEIIGRLHSMGISSAL
jgi:hypothetical protein